ncbi:hypothetical protein VAE151_580024 [Vibrio aestuarianus]|uniref:Uncharacterized protein n=1 Tax=Vibrio aestuarianus TaxID=28171 RepID=A0ABN8TVD7_9VIBR|nr:hypothetical protein VAE308_1080026 [Vibrio aestuarianus]CAH8216129.1 hypothetical protein VAE032_300025 [Vibrio aestuarianus]CAH8216359.1 hypothetical protein VAE130_580146 [Vibrio aestuarianus]CAH8227861.1 hypothetical protein VAE151_580024 [Vibrio aestuarianus]CAH8231277.1 hypothetical protein VAEKB19_4570027 [Vibrio aestuarianus]
MKIIGGAYVVYKENPREFWNWFGTGGFSASPRGVVPWPKRECHYSCLWRGKCPRD